MTSSALLSLPSNNSSDIEDGGISTESSLELLLDASLQSMVDGTPRERRQLWPILEGIGHKIYEGYHSIAIGDFLKTTISLFGSSTTQMLENNGHDSAFVEKVRQLLSSFKRCSWVR
jgi:hypothetical protein